MPDAIITATESTFGTISGTFSADQSTVTGTVTGVITGTLDGSVGVPGPAGPGVPAGGTAGQILQKIDGTNYNTDWVTVNFSATWGDITGTLSNQTDLQTELDLKAPLAGATFTGVVGFNGASGNVAAKSTGYFKAYTSGLESTDYSLQYDTGLQVVVGGTTVARIASSGILAPSAGITFSDATTQTSAGITAATAASTYYLQTNPAGYITSAALSGYATESFVTSQGYITSSALTPYLTTATAASTYFTIASAANKADLASPTFTGVPAAPTAAAATNTTQIATTAFVQQEVPAASTTAAGKVELATRAEAIEPSSSTLAVSPLRSLEMQMHPGFVQVAQNHNNVVTTTSGTGAGIFTTSLTRVCLGPNTSVAGYSYYRPQTNGGVSQFVARGTANAVINFSKKFWMSGRSSYDATNYGDTNNTSRVTVGKSGTGAGALAQKGIGWQKAGGTGSNIFLLAHNGTTLTSVDTNTSLTSLGSGAGACFDWFIYSDGSGNVTMWINDTQVATTSSGPTGNSAGSSVWQEEIDQSSSAARRMYFSNFSGHYYHV